jgi:hypothetical protein
MGKQKAVFPKASKLSIQSMKEGVITNILRNVSERVADFQIPR